MRSSVRSVRQLGTVLVAASLLAAACGSANRSGTPPNPVEPSEGTAAKTTAGPSTSTFGLPFPAGTMVSLGSKGLHDDNFSSLPGGYILAGAGSITTTNPPGVPVASLDLLAPVGTAVTPLAAGTVITAWPDCQVVLVDHGGGTWVEYVHLNVGVAVGAQVTPSAVLGTVLPVPSSGSTPNSQCGDLESTAPHIHLAFLSGSGMKGQYLPMAGRVLCGHTVADSGDLAGLGTVGGAQFTVPDCGGSNLTLSPSPSPVATAVSTGSIPDAGSILTAKMAASVIGGSPEKSMLIMTGMMGPAVAGGHPTSVTYQTSSGLVAIEINGRPGLSGSAALRAFIDQQGANQQPVSGIGEMATKAALDQGAALIFIKGDILVTLVASSFDITSSRLESRLEAVARQIVGKLP